MTLNGGDPERLTLRRFLDVAQALLVQEYVRSGMDLMTALQNTRDLAVGFKGEEAEQPEVTALRNDQALADLQRALGGVSIG